MREIQATLRAVTCVLAVLLASCPLAAEELSLQQAVDEAIKNNPTTAAAALSANAAIYTASGAKALVNPEISVAPSVVGDAGADSALFFSQPLEINGSRRVRGRIASNLASAAAYDAQVVRRDVILQVKLAYWNLARAQELVKLSNENLAYLQEINAAVQRQCEVGVVPEIQLTKTEIELARARQELAQAELDLAQSRAELAALLNRPSTSPLSASSPLVFTQTTLNRESLLTSCAIRPEISSAQAVLAASRNEIKAANIQQIPDIAVQARQESFSSDSDSGVALALTLPILDWGSIRAEKRRARSAAMSQEKQLQAVRNDVALQVEQAAQQVEISAGVVREYQSGILSKSEELAAAARKGYEKGVTNYLEVLEAQRTLRSVRSEYASALAEYNMSLARLEWASGCDVASTKLPEVKR